MHDNQLTLDTYVEYQEPPEEWMGEIPAEWETKRARFCFREVDERSETGNQELMSLSKDHGLVPRKDITDDVPRADSLEGYKMCQKGDIVMNKMQAWNGQFGIADQSGIVSPDYTVFRPEPDSNPDYFLYLLRTPMYVGQFKWRSRGIGTAYLRLHTQQFYDVPLYFPPPKVQTKIAEFLDQRTDQIDELIRKKKRLLELLTEKWDAIITDSVTNGIQSNTHLHKSEHEYLESYPDHWQRTSLRWGCESIRDGTHNPPSREPGKYRLLSVRNMVDGWLQFRDDDRTMGEEAFQKLQQSYTVEEHDVLLAIVGGTTGKVARVPPLENFTVQRSTAIVRPDTQVLNSDYLYYWLRSYPVQTTIQSTYEKYAAQPGIYLKDVANLPLLVPPLEEQANIASYLDDQRTSHKKLENNIQKSIDLLEEKRQALITDATTGKINITDIRQADKQEVRG